MSAEHLSTACASHSELSIASAPIPNCEVNEDENNVSTQQYKKRSRENTDEERKAMKKSRKRRRRKKKVNELMTEIDTQKKLRESAIQSNKKYVSMCRTYWERWRWELQVRRDLMINERLTRRCSQSKQVVKCVPPCIDPSMLEDPLIDGRCKECYVGRGSFRIVRLQVFRGINVAVKEFLPRTLREDVTNEALILASLCHPYLPLLFGVCLKEEPYRLVMQFHATDDKSGTLFQELRDKKSDSSGRVDSSNRILAFCVQLVEAVHYLHHEVEILHNDITTTNIVLDNDHVVLIDFGKATKISEAKLYHLAESEKVEYMTKYTHMAPEVVYGQQRQSIYSDMHAVGLVLYHVCDHGNISQLMKKSLKCLAEKCRSVQFFTRPKSSDALKYLQGVLI